MRNLTPCFLALFGLMCGCAHEHFIKGRGDVGQFIVQQAIVRCGVSPSTNGLPAISARWQFSEDDQGVVIQMPRELYPVVESFLRQAFGVPKFGPVDTKDGCKLGVYRLTPKGGGIQFSFDAKRTQVIVLRPLAKQEFRASFQKAIQDKRFLENMSK